MTRRPDVPERTTVSGSSAVAVGIVAMNLCTYAYTIATARLLGPGGYGAFAALMGLLLVIGVVQLGLQATAARRIASTPEHVAEIEASILRVGYRAGVVVALVCLASAPVVDAALRLHSLTTAALLALAALPMTVIGAQYGILQGERRWRPLAIGYLAFGVPRLLVGTALVAIRPTETVAMAGLALSLFVPVGVNWWMLRHSREHVHPSGEHGIRDILGETLHNSHALLAFLALSNADILVARHVLDAHAAGLYAGGAIAVKAVLFLPQFVVVIAFPSMSTVAARGKALFGSLGLVAGLGLLAALACWVLSGLALVFVGGAKYAQVQDSLWKFALLGTVLSLLQLLVYAVVARQSRTSVFWIWAALVVVVVLGQGVSTFGALVVLVLGVDAALVAVLLVTSTLGLRADTAAEVPAG